MEKDSNVSKDDIFPAIEKDRMLMNINMMYLSVYIIMLTEIVFFLAFIRILQTAIKNEEES